MPMSRLRKDDGAPNYVSGDMDSLRYACYESGVIFPSSFLTAISRRKNGTLPMEFFAVKGDRVDNSPMIFNLRTI